MYPKRGVDAHNCVQRLFKTSRISNLKEDFIPDSQVAGLCSEPSGVAGSKYSYSHESDCYIASKGFVKVGRHLKEHRRMRRSLNLAQYEKGPGCCTRDRRHLANTQSGRLDVWQVFD